MSIRQQQQIFHPLNLFFLSAGILLASVSISGQPRKEIPKLNGSYKEDTSTVNLLQSEAEFYFFSNPDSSFYFSNAAATLAHTLEFDAGELRALNNAGEALRIMGDFPQALEMQFRAIELNRAQRDKKGEAITMSYIGFIFIELDDNRQALTYLKEAEILHNAVPVPARDTIRNTFNLSNIGAAYKGLNQLDSALFYQQLALKQAEEVKYAALTNLILGRMGMLYSSLGNETKALQFYRQIVQNGVILPNIILYQMSKSFQNLHQPDSSLYYARQAFTASQLSGQKKRVLDAANLLAKLFRVSGELDSVVYYQDFAIAMNDSLFGPRKIRQLQQMAFTEQQRKQEIIKEKEKYRERTKTFALIAGLAVFLILAILLLRNNRQKQKANKILETTLNHLKDTQSQLIQSEKMASLGSLTAGIAHEIQNPLNFVNNFSELNQELIGEMKQEYTAGNMQQADKLADSIKENEEKINQHGKRADAIVKSMLQHSRVSSGKKEPTDINNLAEEYLRLAYHGLRAKDKTFNTKLETNLDPLIGKIDVVTQDIGRVVLNLVNNALFSVGEKIKISGHTYEPCITLSTFKKANDIEIRIRDNGMGISAGLLEKVFQPFFTTKPTGQGTGLGLSLSYDIIKAHGGEIKVETKEGEHTVFIIILPLKPSTHENSGR